MQTLCAKIERLKSAIFYSHSQNPLKINNSVIHNQNVDASGYISFFIKRPVQLISQFDQEFLVGLNYFKKDVDFFINVKGRAIIVTDPEVLSNETNLSAAEINNALTTHVLIKVKILQAEMHPRYLPQKMPLLQSVVKEFVSIFQELPSPRIYNFRHDQGVHNFGY